MQINMTNKAARG